MSFLFLFQMNGPSLASDSLAFLLLFLGLAVIFLLYKSDSV